MSKLLKKAAYIRADDTDQHSTESIVQKTTRTTINRSNHYSIKKITPPVKLALHQEKSDMSDPNKNDDTFSEDEKWPVEVYYSFIPG